MIRNFLNIVIACLIAIACRSKSENENEIKKQITNEDLIEINRALIKKDRQRISAHISRMGWDMQESETGLWYEIIENGEGDTVRNGNKIKLEYSLMLMDGAVCYSSKKSGPKEFVVGKGNVESGLEQAVLYLKKGSKARFILPPYLAHGLTGDGNKIPARAIIIYEVKLISLSKSLME